MGNIHYFLLYPPLDDFHPEDQIRFIEDTVCFVRVVGAHDNLPYISTHDDDGYFSSAVPQYNISTHRRFMSCDEPSLVEVHYRQLNGISINYVPIQSLNPLVQLPLPDPTLTFDSVLDADTLTLHSWANANFSAQLNNQVTFLKGYFDQDNHFSGATRKLTVDMQYTVLPYLDAAALESDSVIIRYSPSWDRYEFYIHANLYLKIQAADFFPANGDSLVIHYTGHPTIDMDQNLPVALIDEN